MNARKIGDRIALAALGILALIGGLAAIAALGGTEDDIRGALLVFIAAVIYLAPSIVARQRHAPNAGSVVVVNVLLGWTVIGWVVALAMAYRDPRNPPAE
jgi:drug/metabolite transporter (DMT)-like permease